MSSVSSSLMRLRAKSLKSRLSLRYPQSRSKRSRRSPMSRLKLSELRRKSSMLKLQKPTLSQRSVKLSLQKSTLNSPQCKRILMRLCQQSSRLSKLCKDFQSKTSSFLRPSTILQLISARPSLVCCICSLVYQLTHQYQSTRRASLTLKTTGKSHLR